MLRKARHVHDAYGTSLSTCVRMCGVCTSYNDCSLTQHAPATGMDLAVRSFAGVTAMLTATLPQATVCALLASLAILVYRVSVYVQTNWVWCRAEGGVYTLCTVTTIPRISVCTVCDACILLVNTLYVYYPQRVMMVTMELDAMKSMCNFTFQCMLPYVYDVYTCTGVCIQIALDMATAQNSMALVSVMR